MELALNASEPESLEERAISEVVTHRGNVNPGNGAHYIVNTDVIDFKAPGTVQGVLDNILKDICNSDSTIPKDRRQSLEIYVAGSKTELFYTMVGTLVGEAASEHQKPRERVFSEAPEIRWLARGTNATAGLFAAALYINFSGPTLPLLLLAKAAAVAGAGYCIGNRVHKKLYNSIKILSARLEGAGSKANNSFYRSTNYEALRDSMILANPLIL